MWISRMKKIKVILHLALLCRKYNSKFLWFLSYIRSFIIRKKRVDSVLFLAPGRRHFLSSSGIWDKKVDLMVVSAALLGTSHEQQLAGCWNQYPVGSLSRVVDLPPQMWSGKNEWRRRRNDVMLFQVHGQTYKNSSLPSYEELLSVSNYFLLD